MPQWCITKTLPPTQHWECGTYWQKMKWQWGLTLPHPWSPSVTQKKAFSRCKRGREFQNSFQQLIKCWHKRIAFQGEYFKGDKYLVMFDKICGGKMILVIFWSPLVSSVLVIGLWLRHSRVLPFVRVKFSRGCLIHNIEFETFCFKASGSLYCFEKCIRTPAHSV